MTQPPTPTDGGAVERAVLWTRGSAAVAETWAAQGVLPVAVADHDGWVMIASAGRAEAPGVYGQQVPMLLGRIPSARLRPAIGIGVRGPRAIVVLHTPGWRPLARWAAVDPARGHLDLPGLPPLGALDLARVAGVDDGEAVADALAGLEGGDPVNPGDVGVQAGALGGSRLARRVAAALALPGHEALDPLADTPPGGLVSPQPRQVARFADVVESRVRLRDELGLGDDAHDDGAEGPAGRGASA